MKKNLLKFVFVLLLLSSKAYSQSRTITGTVTGKDDGAPIPGVTVVVAGTKSGVTTNGSGSYTIKVPSGPQSLVFTSIGYLKKTEKITGSILNVSLESDTKSLAEVQVVGYGTTTKRANVGNIATVKGSEVVEQPVQNFQQALGGRAPGAQITIANGVSNTTPVFRIRGTNSISLSSQPLFVVDGVTVFAGDYGNESGGSALSNIDPNDIESIDIAKDGAATAIYGSQGANGVVFITTKKGKKGTAVISVNAYTGVTNVSRLPQVLNAAQYVALKNEAMVNAGVYSAATVPASGFGHAGFTTDASGNQVDTKWADLVYHTGKTYNVSTSISGGTEKTTYYGSANWSSQEGIIRRDAYKNKGMNFNIDHKANKYITLGMKVSYVDQLSLAAVTSGSLAGEQYATAGLGREALLLPPDISPYNADGSYNTNGAGMGTQGNVGSAYGTIAYTNPVSALALDRANAEISHTSANVYLQVKPTPWITLKTLYGADIIFNTADSFTNPITNYVSGVNTASALAFESTNKRYVWDNTAQFDHTFFGKHNFSLLLGNEQRGTNTNSFQLNRSVLSDPAFNVIQAGYSTTTYGGGGIGVNYLVSFFGRLNYNFDEKYFLSGTIRRDGYSGFGADKKYGYFPGFGASWVVDKEKFWDNMHFDKVFSSLKLRGSYAQVGNSNVGDFGSYTLYSASGLYNGQGTVLPSSTGNDKLGWETSKKTDIGFTVGFFKDRLTLDAAAYYNNINGLLYNVPAPPSAGLASNPLVNVGSMWNKGLEFDLNASIIQNSSFRWTANFNISFNQNKITALATGINQYTSGTTTSEITNISQVGYSIGNLWMIRSAGVDPNNGRRIWINAAGTKVEYAPTGTTATPTQKWYYMDGTAAPAITQAADAVNYANSTPKAYGGFSNTFSYKGFDLNILCTYQLGFSVYYGTQATLTDQRFWNNSTIILNHWTTPGQTAQYPQVYYGDNVSNGTGLPSDFNVYKGDFLKLKTVNFGYTIPKNITSKVNISNLRVFVSAQNLAIITKYPGPDPEVSAGGTGNSTQGIDRNTAANARVITAGISLKF
ncbi:SusC/RagA family TonB-linked outer membrane protein [Mucilaginibacter boryungensis]|uniref:SusC/RagA family TonB-linked outer membrane protein n=1 Tax=Mucilaginibacter boryungensis TaxID=768480 RepID=A0ABR9XNA4_9SPHI|nr:SusC/RagA family TonB-linked outer membrane protein [Mucilaginibacter boryungensis]MBE9668707.1 SusC/RagA family TonB-linked outer membrane protein [Mucilaginibacter boryungensis]